MSHISVNDFVQQFEAGAFNSPDTRVQIDAGWYDWFCKPTSLTRKTQILGRKVVQLSKSKLFDPEKTYVFFKNNCPVNGSLFDSFSICDLETDNVLFWVCPAYGHNGPHKGKPMLTDYTNKATEFEFDSWKGVLKHFGV